MTENSGEVQLSVAVLSGDIKRLSHVFVNTESRTAVGKNLNFQICFCF